MLNDSLQVVSTFFSKTLGIAYYISFYIRYLGILEILQYDNSREFKGVILIFPKKHNIKLIDR